MRSDLDLAGNLFDYLKMIFWMLNSPHYTGCRLANPPPNRLQMRQEEQRRFSKFVEAGFDFRVGTFGTLLCVIEREIKTSSSIQFCISAELGSMGPRPVHRI